jgi:hypothetical protein
VLRGPLEVVAGRERAVAGAGQHHDADVVVRRQVVPAAVELLVRRRVEGVHHVGRFMVMNAMWSRFS